MDSKLDYIVVGAGLAGLLLALELEKRGKKFVVYCNDQPASSNVAAGTWNPVSFRTMGPTWRAQEMIDKMKEVYEELDQRLGSSFFNFLKVEKVLTNDQEKDFWLEKAKTEASKDFLSKTVQDVQIKGEQMYLGNVKQTGRLDLPRFVEKLRTYFESKGQLVFQDFDHKQLDTANGFSINDHQADRIVFAEGTYVQNNPWFNWVPLRPVKGDVLTIKSKDLKVDAIRKKNVFILPIGDDLYKVGATYHRDNLTWEPTEKARIELIEKFEKLVDCEYEILDQKSGIRPATHDRRVIMGEHPETSQMYLFNGLGSKGVFLGPLLAQEFFDSIDGTTEIHPEVSINRIFKKYYKKSK